MKPVLGFLVVACGASAQPLDVPFFQQQKNGCGAASVAMVMRYWQLGAPSPESVYRELYRAELTGIPLADMRRYLEGAGFRAFTLRGQWTDVEQHLSKRRPIIVGLKRQRAGRLHFAVLVGAGDEYIWLNDPTRKKAARVKRTEFERQWALADRWMLLSTPAVSAPDLPGTTPVSSGTGSPAPRPR